MIIFGTNSMHLSNGHLFSACPYCKANDSINISFYQRYAHVYAIPIFPLDKTGAMQCSKCNHIIADKDLSPALAAEYNDSRKKQRTPKRTFAFLAIIAVIGVAGYIMSELDSKEDAEKIATPKVGDKYRVENSSNSYTLYRVVGVQKDSILFQENEYESDGKEGVDNLLSKPFSTDTLMLSNKDLKALYDKGTIYNVE